MRYELGKQFLGMFFHPTFWVTATAWLSACFLKVAILKFRSGQFHWERFFGTGGMPSSHMAFAAALTVGIGVSVGFNSAVFGLALGMSILTGVDATGLRRSAGFQAERINQMVAELYKGKKTRPPRLKEHLGHTLAEVIGGALLGALIAFFLYPVTP